MTNNHNGTVQASKEVQTSFLMPETLRSSFVAKAKMHGVTCRALLAEFVRWYVETRNPHIQNIDFEALHTRVALSITEKPMLDNVTLLALHELMTNPTCEEHEHLVALIRVALKKYA